MSYMKDLRMQIEEAYHNDINIRTCIYSIMQQYDVSEEYARMTVANIYRELDDERQCLWNTDPY